MNTLNIGKIILEKRRQKGITQEALANYLGVSKASVSKWETRQSYPDIMLLPELSTYFNISIDELIGYSPQLTKEDIKKYYQKLADDFASKPFDSVYASCQQLIKEYYACQPFLYEMAILFVNHSMLASNSNISKEVLEEAVNLCQRVKSESDDLKLIRDATSLEATTYLMMADPHKVLDLLGETGALFPQDTEMIAQAYQLLGNTGKAKEILQSSIYQHLLMLVGTSPSYLMMHSDDPDKFEEILKRSLAVAQIYDLESLHPNTMAQIYYTAAHYYCQHVDKEAAYQMLHAYANVCQSKFFPFSLHGDHYFDLLENWFEEIELSTKAPRNDALIIDSMVDGLKNNPVFEPLKNEKEFKQILTQLENLKGEAK